MTPGVLLDRACAAFGIDPFKDGLQILAARELDLAAAPLPSAHGTHAEAGTAQSLPSWVEQQKLGVYAATLLPYPLVATRPALVWQLEASRMIGVLHGLLLRYPPTHQVRILLSVGPPQSFPLEELSHYVERDPLMMYLPPLPVQEDLRGADGPTWVAARLLGPNGCPWDIEQTHQSLRTGLLEEAYEVLEALDAGDMVALVEELGDLMLQTLVHAEMARQAGHFDLGDVCAQLGRKLINRHPHVFGSLAVDNTGEVLRNWEAIKAQELATKGRERASVLDGVPVGLPALASAQKLLKKATRVGFAWPNLQAAWGKLHEELDELEAELPHTDAVRTSQELGDVLFALVTLAQWLHIDAETALRETNAKFRQRFATVEEGAQAQGRAVSELSLAEMQELWAEAKKRENK